MNKTDAPLKSTQPCTWGLFHHWLQIFPFITTGGGVVPVYYRLSVFKQKRKIMASSLCGKCRNRGAVNTLSDEPSMCMSVMLRYTCSKKTA